MRRKVFDRLVSLGGALLVVVLVAAGGMLMWGYNFANSTVHSQLAQQQIYFPAKAAFSTAKAGGEITPGMIPYIYKYAGQEVTTGPQAEAYANHFIAVHLSEMPYNGVYAKISGAAMANPTNTQLKGLEQASFQGTTLRGLLLEAYGFWKMGQIALYGAIVSFMAAGLLSLLVGLGIWHARRVPAEEELFHKGTAVKPVVSVA